MKKRIPGQAAFLLLLAALRLSLPAQVGVADYERAAKMKVKLQPLALNIIDRSGWIEGTNRLWYRKSVPGGFEFIVLDAPSLKKSAAFDHEKLAAALAKVTGDKADPKNLPFSAVTFVDNETALEFDVGDVRYRCDLAAYACKKVDRPAPPARGIDWKMWERGPAPEASSTGAKTSPDGKIEAFIRNYNVHIRRKDSKDEKALSRDGSEGNYYTFSSLAWSPDSRKLAAFRLRRGYHRILHYVESSPSDQLQPKHYTMEYAKPGDALDVEQPVLFLAEEAKAVEVDNTLFPNPYELGEPVWRKDSRAFTFEYNQRGHQVYRIIEVDGTTGEPRAVVSEEPRTFFYYSQASARGDGGKKFRFDLEDGRRIIWMSERDGWNHLYLIQGATGTVENPITKGDWVVRGVEKVDEEKRQVCFCASGMYPGKDPYFLHYYRVNFDGTGLVPLTEADGNHSVIFSPDRSFYIDTWSRVDAPPVTELRRSSDLRILMTVEQADIRELVRAGWRAPEAFVAKGRDGRTDIWGVIVRPMNFNPKKKYPVIEYIYAGPHSSFVPKSFQGVGNMQALAEMGFIVSQVDGMGTSNRSKAFHDICWKNLGDAGFPDRILWHRAAAARYPSYDITRVGIYGNSAGGQNALGGLLFHPEFYKVGVSSCGCHDNRMDKIWWNEQWMGWPLGTEYAASSNVDNAHRLRGRLLLILGEMDTNVDPASTMQVVNALIKADKVFDLLVIPGGGHGMGGAYGNRKMVDFFVRHLQAHETPDWNRVEKKPG